MVDLDELERRTTRQGEMSSVTYYVSAQLMRPKISHGWLMGASPALPSGCLGVLPVFATREDAERELGEDAEILEMKFEDAAYEGDGGAT